MTPPDPLTTTDPGSDPRPRVLVVEDHPLFGPVVAAKLRDRGYAVDLAAGLAGADALLSRAAAEGDPVGVAVVDLSLDDADPRRTIGWVAARRPLPCVVLSALLDDETVAACRAAGASDVQEKTAALSERGLRGDIALVSAIDHALRDARVAAHLARALAHIHAAAVAGDALTRGRR